ncbi:TetR/AcrR family transcriptional regulator [Psittacicella hinzii]|uniref:HTH tetR-type domain-containing protein n=1 Tax=Psittacicella hinzii TaxID=2028575 RepID=A0A3A1YBR7_9GAMM|nr:TetR/AcrR family transcriptional regulator [Psittacicella hinzii]RIY35713.1 hypothetical protein CKF58_06485 [Psittacicella hinzii]
MAYVKLSVDPHAPKQGDLRVTKTNKLIRSAMIQLLLTKPYEDIIVQDILDLAMVNRATFYKYYTGKDDLVGKMIADLKRRYFDLIRERLETRDFNVFFNKIFPQIFVLREEFLALWKIQTPRHRLYQEMVDIVSKRYLFFSEHAFPQRNPEDTKLQSIMFGNLVMTTMKYFFEAKVDIQHLNIVQQLKNILEMIQFNFASLPDYDQIQAKLIVFNQLDARE